MADIKTGVEVGADTSQAESALGGFASKFEDVFSAILNGSIKDVIVAVGSLPAAVTAAAAGIEELGKKIADVVLDTTHMIAANIDLGARLGISVSEASALTEALKEVGVTTDTYAGAVQRMNIQLRAHEDAINKMKVATRDSNGNLLSTEQIVFNATQRLAQFRDGEDRAQAAMVIFGGRVANINQLLRLTPEALEEVRQRQASLGLATQESTDNFLSYQKGIAAANDVLDALKNQVTNAVLPSVTKLAEYINNNGISIVNKFKESIDTLTLAFNLVLYPITLVWDAILGLAGAVKDIAFPTIDAFNNLVHLRFRAAWTTIKEGFHEAQDGANDWSKNTTKDLDAVTAKIAASIKALTDLKTAQSTPAGKTQPQGSDTFDPNKEKDKSEELVRIWQQEIAQRLFLEQHFGEQAKAEESAFWADKLSKVSVNSKAYLTILSKVYSDENALAEKAKRDNIKTSEDALKSQQDLALEDIDFKEKLAAEEVKSKEITEKQKLQIDKDEEAQRYQIQIDMLTKQMDIDNLDLVHKKELEQQILLLKKKSADAQVLLSKQAADQQDSIWKKLGTSISSDLGNALTGMLQKTTSFVNAMKGLWNSLVSTIINLELKLLADHIEKEQLKTGATQAGVLSRLAIEAEGYLKSAASQALAAVKWILTEAWKAASGMFSSVASLPPPASFGAPAAAAAVFAAVEGFASNVPAAAGGWMVPDDTLAMVHKDERILPARYSAGLDALVGRAADGNSRNSTQNFHYHAGANETPQSIFANQKAFERMARHASRRFAGNGVT